MCCISFAIPLEHFLVALASADEFSPCIIVLCYEKQSSKRVEQQAIVLGVDYQFFFAGNCKF